MPPVQLVFITLTFTVNAVVIYTSYQYCMSVVALHLEISFLATILT